MVGTMNNSEMQGRKDHTAGVICFKNHHHCLFQQNLILYVSTPAESEIDLISYIRRKVTVWAVTLDFVAFKTLNQPDAENSDTKNYQLGYCNKGKPSFRGAVYGRLTILHKSYFVALINYV